MELCIREAKRSEHEKLTQIGFAAKRYWDYPQEYFAIWKDELTITEKYIDDNVVFAVRSDEVIVAYYSIVQVAEDFFAGETKVEKGFWLEHMFVLPEHIGKGIGKAMYRHAIDFCRDNDIEQLRVFADPNAKGFYEKQGANYLQERPSNIEGRNVGLYCVKV